MTPDEQLTLWVAGESVHNEDRDECCPDFSCCRPHLKWTKAVRERFRDADEPTRERMLIGSLTGLVAAEYADNDVRVIGDADKETAQ